MIVGKNSANFPPREINHLHVKKKDGYWAALSFHFAPFIRRKSARIMERSGRGDFSNSFCNQEEVGGRDRDRTGDPLLAKHETRFHSLYIHHY
jgi:hypothetical protein